ncbi:MAG: molecular chaperone TorD family protein [Acidobacteria bacterium]|nr:molecular chaperone TorD family protein [Acidobacteriota bacterium]MCG3193892.1 hypothetical protein [Thermoanaerobaculia bacterium]MCK6681382.1 molecular chaperone TorD family protein [Thermoanaerobaculia bacterium]
MTPLESPAIRVAEPDAAMLLSKAAEWRLLSLLFERPRAGWLDEVKSLAATGVGEDLIQAADRAAGANEGLYLDALGPGGFTSPREAGHRVAGDPGHILSEIESYYEAFGFRPETEEPADHVSVEAGFLGFLALKEAFALSRGDLEAAEVTREAASKFLENHLAALAEPVATAMGETTVAYLELAGKALLARTGPRPSDLEGYWSPRGLCDVECPMFSCEEGESQQEMTLEEILP